MPVVSGINIGYINFLDVNFSKQKHIVFLNHKNNFDYKIRSINIKLISINFKNPLSLTKLLFHIFLSNQIIIHSFFIYVNIIYLFFPFLKDKSYLVIWGGDLYFYFKRNLTLKNKIIEFLRFLVLNKWNNIITYIDEDFNLFRNVYNSNARLNYCTAYPSNIIDYFFNESDEINKDYINVLVGNSGTLENNHAQAFDYLVNLKKANFKVFCPLSYGDVNYSNNIKLLGKKVFKENFVYLDKLLPNEEYNSFLSTIDIAIMLQERQAAMGNILKLLGLGKKVYFKSNAPHFAFLKRLGFHVYDIDQFELAKITKVAKRSNLRLIKLLFSKQTLIDQWNIIFDKNSSSCKFINI
jgi:dTDP-N-acetylfucosamine:lipid II N-acetylfucosaminyltransferase